MKPAALPLPQLPERHQSIIRGGLIRRIVEQRIGSHALDALASGARDLAGLAQLALSDAVGSLANDTSADAIARISDLLDLLALLGQGISFEAQTHFFRARAGLSPDIAERLAPLALRLGFTDR